MIHTTQLYIMCIGDLTGPEKISNTGRTTTQKEKTDKGTTVSLFFKINRTGTFTYLVISSMYLFFSPSTILLICQPTEAKGP